MSSDHDISSIQDHIRIYLMVFGALAVLTIVTVLASYLEISTSEGIFLALIIASIKASLVAGYFMHLISERNTIIWILLLTVMFFFVMLFLPLISYTDQVHIQMIGIKTFHLFFIGMSVLLTGWYGYFEMTTPTNPGSVSTLLGIVSLLLMVGLSLYGYNAYNKFKKI